MKPFETLAVVPTPDGGELVLSRRDGVYDIWVDGIELMTSRSHGSEESLARLACEAIAGVAKPRVLVGGLGFGYTLRAALDCLPRAARVVVAEVFPAVVEWNRELLAPLAGRPLEDPRASVRVIDVGVLIRESPGGFDAILLDVDNGPEALTLLSNQRLYGAAGLAALRRALKPGGVVTLWSSSREAAFVQHLRRAGFEARGVTVSARGVAKGPRHTIVVARPDR